MKFLFDKTSLLRAADIQSAAESVGKYTVHLQDVAKKANYDDAESSINLPADQTIAQQSIILKNKMVTPAFKYFIDIGIGGSNLGAKAVYDALYGFFDVIEPNRFPKMIYPDTNDPEFLHKLTDFLKIGIASPDEVIVNIISKSGGTTETVSNFEIIFAALREKIPGIEKRVVVTTDEGSKLWNVAKEKNLEILTLPKPVGGRYCVFSNVGLFPLACAGVDIQSLTAGALDMRNTCISSDHTNPAIFSASVLYMHYKAGKNINDTFLFHGELESVGKWYRQLMGESIGKEHDLDGKVVHAGITPTVSIGSTDLHSMAQLYYGGPRDKITTFISTEKNLEDATVPASPYLEGLVPTVSGKNASFIMHAIERAVKISYQNQGMAFTEVVWDDLSPRSIGAFLQFKMIEMMYLAQLMNVNAFDQPHVEIYKVEMKKILSA